MSGDISFDDLYEMITDEKTYIILEMLKDGERSSEDMIKEAEIFYKTFNYIVSRMYKAGMVDSRTTLRTRFYLINKAGLQELAIKLNGISENLNSAADKLSTYC